VHGDVRDVRTPYLIDPFYVHITQQIRVYRMAWGGLARVRSGRNRLQAHLAHQAANTLVVDTISLFLQPIGHARRSVFGVMHILLVYQSHQKQIQLCVRLWRVVVARTR